jgi:hypothetical protein
MTKQASAVLGVFEFGEQLVKSQDIDPVYTAVWNAGFDNYRMSRFCLAYFCFYHLGTAAWITDSSDYWGAMTQAAASKEYPRGTERRHFRGKQAAQAVGELQSLGLTAPQLLEGVSTLEDSDGAEGLPLLVVMDRVRQWRGFGSWIAFKVADMLERLDYAQIVFKPSDVFAMYETPRKGAEAMASRYQGPAAPDAYLWAYNSLRRKLGHLLAPPRFERKLNIQEIETILCKWKSHLGGHYPLGKDTREIRIALDKFNCTTAKALIKGGTKGGLW